MIFKLIKQEDDGAIVDDIELTFYEFKQALLLHKRMLQRKER